MREEPNFHGKTGYTYGYGFNYTKCCPDCCARYGGGDAREGIDIVRCESCVTRKIKVAKLNTRFVAKSPKDVVDRFIADFDV